MADPYEVDGGARWWDDPGSLLAGLSPGQWYTAAATLALGVGLMLFGLDERPSSPVPVLAQPVASTPGPAPAPGPSAAPGGAVSPGPELAPAVAGPPAGISSDPSSARRPRPGSGSAGPPPTSPPDEERAPLGPLPVPVPGLDGPPLFSST